MRDGYCRGRTCNQLCATRPCGQDETMSKSDRVVAVIVLNKRCTLGATPTYRSSRVPALCNSETSRPGVSMAT